MRNNNFLPKETVLRIIDSPRTKEQMVAMIKGIPEVEAIEIKEDMTNGDMIKAMFPMQCRNMGNENNGIVVDFYGDLHEFNKDWWNSPYKKEAE